MLLCDLLVTGVHRIHRRGLQGSSRGSSDTGKGQAVRNHEAARQRKAKVGCTTRTIDSEESGSEQVCLMPFVRIVLLPV